jgi:hypothetical protein
MAEGRSWAAQVWFGHLDRARAEGVSLKAYAERSGVSLHRLYFWSARCRAQVGSGEAGSALFARVEVADRRPTLGGASQRLYLPSGAVLEWEGAADLALIDRLLGR